MTTLLLSPHDDDNALFAAFTCMRERPLVVVCLDSYIQPLRGERGCSPVERAAETTAAAALLGCDVKRLGLSDATITLATLLETLRHLAMDYPAGTVYSPALQGGNMHHDMVCLCARAVFGQRIVEYTTYTKTELWTPGELEVMPTPAELECKFRVLNCYPSQQRINWPHFAAVINKSEWLNTKQI